MTDDIMVLYAAEKIINPEIFKVGDKIRPWQTVGSFKVDTLCVVIGRNIAAGTLSVVGMNCLGHVVNESVEPWQFKHAGK